MSGVMGRKRSSERVCKQGAWKIHSFFLIRITPVRLLDSPLLVYWSVCLFVFCFWVFFFFLPVHKQLSWHQMLFLGMTLIVAGVV